MRHGIVFQKLSAESASVPTSATEDWLKTFSSLLQKYETDDIFKVDGIDLFFECLSNKTTIFKGDKYKIEKQS